MVQRAGQVIAGKFRLKERIARGGMGAVWTARHLDLDVDVALKFLRTQETQSDAASAFEEEKAEARFRREARALAMIKSPHVVQILDFGVDDRAPYLAMELLLGEDLDDYLTRVGPLTMSQGKSLILQAARGVAAAHAEGIIHRDLKPSNLFLCANGEEILVKVLDFGIAKSAQQEQGDLTTQELILGSPAYMSPEQARGSAVAPTSDLFSLASVFYRAITGVGPFSGANPSDIVVKLCTESPPLPSEILKRPGPEVDAFFLRALQKEPSLRFQNIRDFVQALSALTDGAEDTPLAALKTTRSLPRGRDEETAPLSQTEPPKAVLSRETLSENSSSRPSKWVLWMLCALVFFALSLSLHYLPRSPTSKAKTTVKTTAETTAEGEPEDPKQAAAAHPPLAPGTGTPSETPQSTASDKASEKKAVATDGRPERAPTPVRAPVPDSAPAPRQQTDPVFGLPLDSE